MVEAIGSEVGTVNILITDRIAQEGIELLRNSLPEANIDERLGLKPDQLQGNHRQV